MGGVSLGDSMSTAFTYQGRLKQGGVPVSGSCDFQFGLWTAQGGGSQIGGTFSAPGVTVVNGLFEATIDFGAASFPGEARWLEVAVRCPTGVGGFTPLAPREPLTPAPYALQTRGVFVNDAQKVGIGTLLPSHALTVGSADRATLRLIGPLGGYGWGARLNFGDGDFAFLEEDSDDNLNFRANRFAFSDGRVGIGTSAPAARFDVLSTGETAVAALGNGSFREQATLRVENTQPSAGMAAYIKSQGSYATMHVENDSTGEVLWLQRDNSDGPFIVAHNADTGMRVFSVSQHGYTKVAVLEVAGGADLSEGFDVSSPKPSEGDESQGEPITPQPGMVVSIDTERPGRLLVSSKAYDNAVAGILSGAGGVRPGMIMGQSGTRADGELPVALSGRVYCLCDASKGAIRPGDLLTTSARPGHAMKVTDRDRAAGAVIGKAMTSLEDGAGLVLVLVSLQ